MGFDSKECTLELKKKGDQHEDSLTMRGGKYDKFFCVCENEDFVVTVYARDGIDPFQVTVWY